MEQPLFFTHRGARLYGVLHLPDQTVCARRVGFVLCLPLHDEGVRAYRALVEFARELAGRGFAALLFDYRGCGESEGEFEELSLGTCAEDIRAAIELLMEEAEVDACGLVGLRLGATAAALAASDPAVGERVSRLILWSPVVDTRGYFRDLLRSRQFTEFCCFGRTRSTMQALTSVLEAGEAVDLQGYRVGRQLYQECVLAPPLEGAWSYQGDALIVDVLTKTGRDKSVSRLWQTISSANIRAAYRTVPGYPFWEIPRVAMPTALYETTFRWIESLPRDTLNLHPTMLSNPRLRTRQSVSASAGGSPFSMDEQEGIDGHRAGMIAEPMTERPVSIRVQGKALIGTLHYPELERRDGTTGGIVVVGGGLYRRSGLHRIFVAAARAFARVGFVVLRVDQPGLGDSEGVFQNFRNGEGERYNVDEARTAVEYLLKEIGLNEVTILGQCHGAKTAVLTALDDARVRRLILWSMPMVSVNLGEDRTVAIEETQGPDGGPFERVLDAFVASKRETLLVYGEKDPAFADFEGFLRRRGLRTEEIDSEIPQWEAHRIPYANHDFTTVGWTEEAIQRSLRWLVARQQSDGLFVE